MDLHASESEDASLERFIPDKQNLFSSQLQDQQLEGQVERNWSAGDETGTGPQVKREPESLLLQNNAISVNTLVDGVQKHITTENVAKPSALPTVKLQVMMSLERNVYNAWSTIGNNFGLESHSQVAEFLVQSYQSKSEADSSKSCGTCGSVLSWQCLQCLNKQPKQVGTKVPRLMNKGKQKQAIKTIARNKPTSRQSRLINDQSNSQHKQAIKTTTRKQRQTVRRSQFIIEYGQDLSDKSEDEAPRFSPVAEDSELSCDAAVPCGLLNNDSTAVSTNKAVKKSPHPSKAKQASPRKASRTKKHEVRKVSRPKKEQVNTSTVVKLEEPGLLDSEVTMKKEENASDLPVGEQPEGLQMEGGEKKKKKAGRPRYNVVKSSSGLYECNQCSKSFAIAIRFKQHLRYHKRASPVCDICGRRFSTAHILNIHYKTVHLGQKPYSCNICNQRFSWRSCVRMHKLVAHSDAKPHPCSLCGKSFKTLRRLKSHNIVHSGQRNHVCEVCGKRFKRADNLRRHRLSHSGLKRYVCEICNKAFKRSDELRIHMLKKHATHPPGEVPEKQETIADRQVCDICGRSYASTYMKLHKMTHTGEKPHVCDVCNKSFTQVGTLKTHKLTHTGQKPYKCPHCPKACGSSGALRSHMDIHNAQDGFECEVCHKVVKYYHNFKRHQRQHDKPQLQNIENVGLRV